MRHGDRLDHFEPLWSASAVALLLVFPLPFTGYTLQNSITLSLSKRGDPTPLKGDEAPHLYIHIHRPTVDTGGEDSTDGREGDLTISLSLEENKEEKRKPNRGGSPFISLPQQPITAQL
ncbi:unnamed protein product [Camellia sinensis]